MQPAVGRCIRNADSLLLRNLFLQVDKDRRHDARCCVNNETGNYVILYFLTSYSLVIEVVNIEWQLNFYVSVCN